MSSPSPANPKAKKRQPEPIGLRIKRMLNPEDQSPRLVLVAASGSDAERLKSKGNKEGELIFARMTKPRSPGFHRLAHAIGTLVVENVEGFEHLEAHAALKRLQVESGAGCETMSVEISTIWNDVLDWIGENVGQPVKDMLRLTGDALGIKGKQIPIKVPLSLSYDTMDQGDFKEAIKVICKYLSVRYWPTMTPEQIEEMAEATKDLAK